MRDVADHLAWPFFDDRHRRVVSETATWARLNLADATHAVLPAEVDARCRALVRSLGAAGITRYCVREADGGAFPEFDARALCLVRETLAWWDGLADFSFAMQGLGSGALSLAAPAPLRSRYLPRVASGEAIAAFALSEPDAGSDVAAMTSSARLDGSHYVIDGVKTWVSNGGIADLYCVFARTSPGALRSDGTIGAQGITAFVVEPDDPAFPSRRGLR